MERAAFIGERLVQCRKGLPARTMKAEQWGDYAEIERRIAETEASDG